MNTNGKPDDCYQELEATTCRLRVVQGSVIKLMDERLWLESVAQATTLDEAHYLAQEALRNWPPHPAPRLYASFASAQDWATLMAKVQYSERNLMC